MKILVVDDDVSNRALVKTILVHDGHAVVEAANGEIALELLKSEPFELILSDILMPVMDGYHLCQACKTDPALKSIPFIFCSGTYTDPKDKALSLQFGADAFILKPIDTAALLAAIKRVTAGGSGKQPAPQAQAAKEPEAVYKLYNERLVNKLEEKMLALDKEKMALEMEVAERRKVEEQLRKSRDFAESLFQAAPGIVLILDPEGRIVRFNPYMEKLSGYVLEEVKGRLWREVFSPEDASGGVSDAAGSRNEEAPTVGSISSIRTRAGRKREILWFDSTLKDETGKTIGLLAVGREIERRSSPKKQGKVSETVLRDLDAAGANLLESLDLLEKEMGETGRKSPLVETIKARAKEVLELAALLRTENPASATPSNGRKSDAA